MADKGVNIRITAQDRASAQINAVGKSLAGLGKEVGTVQQTVSALASGSLPALGRSLSGLSSILSGSAGAIGLLTAGVGAAVGGLATFAISTANAVEQLENMSAQTGIAAADLEALQRISEDAGLGTENLASSIGNLNRQLASGEGGDFARVLGALGGSIRDSSGKLKDAITVLDDMRSRLLAIEDSTLRAQLAAAGFGKAQRDLIPLLLNSEKSMREQINAQKESGRLMDEVTRENFKALDKALDEAAADWDRLKTNIASATGALLRFITLQPAVNAAFEQEKRFRAFMKGEFTPPGAPTAAGESPLEKLAETEARAAAIASGKRGQELELAIKIELAESRLAKAKREGQAEAQIAIAQEINLYKQRLEVIKETEQAHKKELDTLKEINREGRRRQAMGEIPAPRESEFLMGREPLPSILTPDQIREMNERMATGFAELQVAAFKTTQKRIDAEADYYLASGTKIFHKLEDMREEAFREQKRQYERMIDGIRDGAGRVFDAMLTKGESVFSSLARFAEGVLQTMLRNIFQNAILALAQSSGILQKLLGGGGMVPGGAPAGGGGGAGAAGLGASAGLGFFGQLFGGRAGVGGGGGATGGMGPFLGEGAGATGATGGFASSAAGASLMAGGALVGQMLMMDAFRRGSKMEGMAGGAMAGASIGTMMAPGIGTAIGAGVGAIAGLVAGMFGGGAKRRAEEAARRAALQEQQKFGAPGTINLFGLAGESVFGIEPDLTGRIRGIGRVPTVIVNVDNSMIDASHAKEAGAVIGQEISRQILAGGSYLADNVAWAAGAP